MQYKRGENTDLGHRIEWSADVEYAFRISRYAFGYDDTCAAFFTNFVDVGASPANDDRGILCDDQASHMDLCRGWSGGVRC